MSDNKLNVTPAERRAIVYALVIALIGGAIFLKPFFALITTAIIFAFLFYPVYDWMLKRWNNPGRASMLTFLVAALAVIIPSSFVAWLSVRQIDSLITNTDFVVVEQSLSDAVSRVNSLLLNFNVKLDSTQISKTIQSSIQSFGQSVVSGLPALFGGLIAFLTSVIIFIYVFLSLLKHNRKIIALVSTLNPLGQDISKLYLHKMSSMTKATVRGQFIIAFFQGLASAIVLSIAGMGDLFFFYLVVLTAVSIIPMGAGIITLPIGIILILSGQVWQGVAIIANHLLVVTNIDNVLRPQLVPRDARLDSALMILAVFAGIAYFGFMGIVLGPVLMIVVVTTINIYLEVYRHVDTDLYDQDDEKAGFIKRAQAKARAAFK